MTSAVRGGAPGGGKSDPRALLDGWDASAAAKPQKRSLTISGHRTSISLEAPFWEGLREVARQKNVSVAALVAAIDAVRGNVSLSTATRLFLYSRLVERI
ncbi:MAG: ribbon-helix-helix domain-containing protein [Rhodomicrobiaceae bacterium]